MERQRKTTFSLTAIALALITLALPVADADDLSGTLNGRVVNFEGTRGVRKVRVVLTSPDDPSFSAEATTDKEGYFTIPVENATMKFKALLDRRGYAVMESAVTLSPGDASERTFTMLTVEEVTEGKDTILRERELAANIDPAAELYNEGVEALAAGFPDTARDRFEAALEHNQNLAPALSGLALIELQRERWTEAASYAARALVLEPDDPVALFTAYRSNKALGNDGQVAEALARLNATGGGVDAAARVFNEGADAYREQDFAAAKERFLEAIELDPTLPESYGALAAIYLNEGQYDEAIASTNTVLALDPDNALALKVRFEAALAGDKDELAAAMSGYAAINKDHVSKAVNKKAFALFEGNNYDEARTLVTLMLRLDWDDPRANYIFGLILVNAGDNGAAREHLEKYIELAPEEDPDVEGARAMLAEIHD